MPISGVTQEEYQAYLAGGGTPRFELDAEDIDPQRGFEMSPLISPHLDSGFELRPSPIIDVERAAVHLLLFGEPWTRLVTHTYRNGGTVSYRRIAPGRYEALASTPLR